MAILKVKCKICGREISKSNFTRHLETHKNGNFDKWISKTHLDHDDLFCKYCGKEYKNKKSLIQHEIRCKENPDRLVCKNSINNLFSYNKDIQNNYKDVWNKGLTKETDERLKKSSETFHKNHILGLHKDFNEWRKDPEKQRIAKEKVRQKALQNHLGWYFNGKQIKYSEIFLSSSYEVKVAESLDENNIKWERPGGIPYIDNNGKFHNYIPDFYLSDYDVYLEPKNSYLIENINTRLGFYDLDKLKWVSEQNNVKIILLTVDELTWDIIKKKINNKEFI